MRMAPVGFKHEGFKKKLNISEELQHLQKAMLTRAKENPLITPKGGSLWECSQTFNPGAILLEGRVHLLYRAIGVDGISRLGYASSKDGLHIDERLSSPAYEHPLHGGEPGSSQYVELMKLIASGSGGGFGGAEDPRIVRVGDEPNLYVTYTAWDVKGIGVALTSITVEDFLNKTWRWKEPVMLSPRDRIHKNWVLFPEKIGGRYAVLHSISPSVQVSLLDDLEFRRPVVIESYHNGVPPRSWGRGWEAYIRGVGPPPLKTEYGWLVFYHAHSKDDFARYKVGALLLDLEEPTRILYWAKEPVLEPSSPYENQGFKPGVIYATGAVVKDGTLTLYYGAADSYVCAAYADLKEFLDALTEKGRAAEVLAPAVVIEKVPEKVPAVAIEKAKPRRRRVKREERRPKAKAKAEARPSRRRSGGRKR